MPNHSHRRYCRAALQQIDDTSRMRAHLDARPYDPALGAAFQQFAPTNWDLTKRKVLLDYFGDLPLLPKSDSYWQNSW
jgi:hypothetical protein